MDTVKQVMARPTKRVGSNPKRVLHVINRMRPGGVQTLVMNLYRHIDHDQLQFDFAVRTQKLEYFDEEIESMGGRIFRLPWVDGNPLSIFAYVHALKSVLREEGPFIALHSHAGPYSGLVLPVGKSENIPRCIAHSHNIADSHKSSFAYNVWGIAMRRRIHASATHLLACSSAAADWLYKPQWQKDSRFIYFPNSINLTQYDAINNDQIYWRKQTGLPLEGPLLGHVGRFDDQKNHTFLLDIFTDFLQVYPQAKLILVGEGILREKILRKAKEKGINRAVCYLGVRSDIPQILGALDLFLFPSLYEGLGIALVEAQAAGVPCLASDVVPMEADLKIGLVKFESLQASTQQWVEKLIASLETHIPPWAQRKAALQESGYDITIAVRQLERIYLDG